MLLFAGCKVKKVTKKEAKIKERTEFLTKDVKTQSEKSNILLSESKKETEVISNKEQNTSLEIKGKVEKDNPLIFYNVINGDTIDLFKVSGNADVLYKSNKSNVNSSNQVYNESNINESKKSEKTNESIVAGVVEKATEIQSKTVDVVKKGFQIGTYITFFLWGLAIIIVCGLIIYFRKTAWFKRMIKKDE